MSDTKISEFPEKALGSLDAAGTADFVGGYDVVSNNKTNKKFTFATLANWLLTKFKLTIAGSSQTVKTAVDTLNSNFTYTTMQSGTNLNSLTTNGNYVVGNIAQMTNAPTDAGSSGLFYVVKSSTQNYIEQRFYGNLAETYRMSYDNGSTWNTWNTSALKSDSNLLTGGNTIPNNQDLNTLLTPGNYYAYNNVTISNGPVQTFSGIIKVYSSAGQADTNYVKQVLSRYDKVEQYERYTYLSSGNRVFSPWVLLPSRAEVDALTNGVKGTIIDFSASSPATITLASNKYASIYILSGNECGMYFANTNAFDTAYVKEIMSLSGVTVSTSNNTITISSSGRNGTVVFAPVYL